MTLEGYINQLKEQQRKVTDFRSRVIEACFDLPVNTYYYWINNPNKIPQWAREKIAEVVGKPQHELWPEKENIKQ